MGSLLSVQRAKGSAFAIIIDEVMTQTFGQLGSGSGWTRRAGRGASTRFLSAGELACGRKMVRGCCVRGAVHASTAVELSTCIQHFRYDVRHARHDAACPLLYVRHAVGAKAGRIPAVRAAHRAVLTRHRQATDTRTRKGSRRTPAARMPRAESKSMDSAASSAQSAETKTEEKQDFDENELLMYVAADANEHLFGEKSELTQFVNAHAADFETALDGDRTGAGTPIKQAERWRSAHSEYNEIMEEILEALVKKNNGTIEAFMKDVQCALGRRRGFLFEDDNYSEFVERIQAMDDYGECRHRIMCEAAQKARSRRSVQHGVSARFIHYAGVFNNINQAEPRCRGGRAAGAGRRGARRRRRAFRASRTTRSVAAAWT